MAVKTYSLKKDGNKPITEHFKVKEFRCKDGTDKILISTELVEMLEKLREKLNCSININSGYRTEAHNKSIGGSSTSKHCKGLAVDIVCKRDGKTVASSEVCCAAQDLNFPGIAKITTGATHLDVRQGKWWADESKNNRKVTDFYTYFGVERPKTATATVSVLDFQKAAIADGFKFPKTGADGVWGSETEAVTKKAVVKKRLTYKYKNCTKLVQSVCGVEVDGYCGKDTDKAIRTWQKLHGLAVDGAFGTACWKKLLVK